MLMHFCAEQLGLVTDMKGDLGTNKQEKDMEF